MTVPFNQITIDQAKDMMDKGAVSVVDIRDLDSFSTSHIHHAVSVNEDNVEEFLKTTNKEKPLICYCYHGMSSQGAAAYFVEHGFKEVYSMEGGFEKWRAVYPTTEN